MFVVKKTTLSKSTPIYHDLMDSRWLLAIIFRLVPQLSIDLSGLGQKGQILFRLQTYYPRCGKPGAAQDALERLRGSISTSSSSVYIESTGTNTESAVYPGLN